MNSKICRGLISSTRQGFVCISQSKNVHLRLPPNRPVMSFGVSRAISSSTSLPQIAEQLQKIDRQTPHYGINRASEGDRCIKVKFSDGSKTEYPFLWLRDNCQCEKCFSKVSLGRKFLMQNLELDLKPIEFKASDSAVKVTWNDGHQSEFESYWLFQRSFEHSARDAYKTFYRRQRKPWSSDIQVRRFNYEALEKDDSALLDWLLTMEIDGVAVIESTPDDSDAGAKMIDRIAFVKQSHYGRSSPVIVRESSNNVAFSNDKLGLHNDLAQYHHQAGIIFIQTVMQDKGDGGESVVSDGLTGVQILKEKHPKEFNLLSNTNVYFWDKGVGNYSWESEEFHKITKEPVIKMDVDGNLEALRVNNQVRDSFLDMDSARVNEFYAAMKTLDDILYENSLNFKMKDGDTLTLDNIRCLHGRNAFAASSGRHVQSAYLDWDEALCKRRLIQERLGIA